MSKRFPVLGAGFSVPWEMVEPFDQQARENHDQSLQRLAERGGLDPRELWAVMHGRKYYEASRDGSMPSEKDALEWVRSLVGHEKTITDLRAELAKRDEALRLCVEALEGAIAGLRRLGAHGYGCATRGHTMPRDRFAHGDEEDVLGFGPCDCWLKDWAATTDPVLAAARTLVTP